MAAVLFAHRDANLHALADLDGLDIRNLFANGHGNLLHNFLADHLANLDVDLFLDVFLDHAAGANRADLIARNPHFMAAPRGRLLLDAGDALEPRQQAAMAATTRIARVAVVVIAGADEVVMGHATARLANPFAFPFAGANRDLLLFPNRLANRLANFADLHFFDRLADRITAFLHDGLLHGLAAGHLLFFGHVLIASLIANLGIVAGVLITGGLAARAEQPRLARARAQQNTQGRENGSN